MKHTDPTGVVEATADTGAIGAAESTDAIEATGTAEAPDSPGDSEAREESPPDPIDDDRSSANCMVGDWVVADFALGEWYAAFAGGEGISVGSARGEVLLSSSDSDFIYSTDAGLAAGRTRVPGH